MEVKLTACPSHQASLTLTAEWGTDRTHGAGGWRSAEGLLTWTGHLTRGKPRPTDASPAELPGALLRTCTGLTLTGLNLHLAETNDEDRLLIYELHFWRSRRLIHMLEQGPFLVVFLYIQFDFIITPTGSLLS